MDEDGMSKKLPFGVDMRVSMLANAINSSPQQNPAISAAITELTSKLRSAQGSRSTSPAKHKPPAERRGPPIQQQTQRWAGTQTQQTSNPVQTRGRETMTTAADEGWESFTDVKPIVSKSATPSPSLARSSPSVGFAVPRTPVIPPPPKSFPPAVLVSTIHQTKVKHDAEIGNGNHDNQNASIGTQTEKKVLITDVSTNGKAKTPKMKTKSLQIDFPKSGVVKARSLLSRSRSLTPTRYKELIEEANTAADAEKTTTSEADKKEKKEKKDKDNNKNGNKKAKRARRSQSLSPARRRRTAKSERHERVIVAKVKPKPREIIPTVNRPKTVIVRERTDQMQGEETKKASNSKSDDKSKGDEDQSKHKKQNKNEEKRKRDRANKESHHVRSRQNKTGQNEENASKVSKSSDEKGKNETTHKDSKTKTRTSKSDDEKTGNFKSSDKTKVTEKEDAISKKSQSITVLEKETEKDKNELTKTGSKRQATPKKVEMAERDTDDNTDPSKAGNTTHDVIIEVDECKDDFKNEEEKIGDNTMEISGAGKEEQQALITEDENADREVDLGNFQPPGDEELEYYEDLLATNEEDGMDDQQDLDPELVKRTEDQIFSKIKFYKGVISDIKEKPWTLRKKVKLLKEAREYTARFEGKLSAGGGPSKFAEIKVAWAKTSRSISNYMALMVPWEGKIRQIESYFGGVVASYFTFLRWIFWTNMVQTAIMIGVIVMPEIMFGPDWGTVDYKQIPVNETKEASYLQTAWDFEGYVKYSPLFYGYYSGVKKFSSGYRMPLAFLIANMAQFAYSFIAILRQIAANAKDEKASDKDDNFTFSWKAFASWDYMIGNTETAKNKFKSVVLAIRESITDEKEAKKKISGKRKFLRVLANFCVVLVLASSTYAISLTVSRSREFEQRIKTQGPDSVNAWERNEISVVMSLVTSFFPILFDLIAGLEDYHPRIALQWSLGRIMVLYLLNLYTLYIALYWKIQDLQKGADAANSTYYGQFNSTIVVFCNENEDVTTTLPTATNVSSTAATTTPVANHSCVPHFEPEITCWETMVGQELFKLTMFDLVTTIAVIYASEFFRALFIKNFNACWCWDLEKHLPGYATFSLAENLLHLVYNQGMIWMGTLFSPGLPGFNLIKLLVMFYVRAWSVMVCNVPEERIFKAGSANFYLLLLLFMLYVVMIPIAFAMVSIKPSPNCGPFRDVQFMYLALTEWLQEALPSNLYAVLSYLTSPGALIPIFVLLFLILNYLKSNNEALKGATLDLKKQLRYERTEGKKKVFNMADTNKTTSQAAAPKQPTPVGASMTALKALKNMGAFKNRGDNPTAAFNSSETSENQATNPSLMGVVGATRFLAKMRKKAQQNRQANMAQAPNGLNV